MSWSRTVSLSVMLSAPSEYTGGMFETPDGPVHAEAGECIAITSTTRHCVTPVESGRRLVLIAFGAWDGWSAS
jgi:predicted 2-oxoglutarate/Fe(II)-dependent dioxygenase YbiX